MVLEWSMRRSASKLNRLWGLMASCLRLHTMPAFLHTFLLWLVNDSNCNATKCFLHMKIQESNVRPEMARTCSLPSFPLVNVEQTQRSTLLTLPKCPTPLLHFLLNSPNIETWSWKKISSRLELLVGLALNRLLTVKWCERPICNWCKEQLRCLSSKEPNTDKLRDKLGEIFGMELSSF